MFRNRPIIAGAVLGILVGLTPFFEPIEQTAQALLGFGLMLTYASIGILVALLPSRRPYWLFGAIVGALYSLPGAVFTCVPYPLAADAPQYWHEFASGGPGTFLMTLFAGAFVGLICGALKRDPLPR